MTGNAVVAGNIAAKYQDVAEWVDAAKPITPATLVILDPARTNAVVPSGRSYDTTVAGVVSARPGLILGEAGAGKVLVATTGRVKVKVDATRHAIKIGDLLVASDKPGVAMKSMPIIVRGVRIHRPGTIVGKALNLWRREPGEIISSSESSIGRDLGPQRETKRSSAASSFQFLFRDKFVNS